MIVCCASVSACADILGIEDGTPREYDASAFDAPMDTTVLPDAKVVDVVSADVPIDVPTSPLACGTSTCNALKEGCCRTGSFSQADAESFACVPSAAACDGGLFVTCDEPANCAAQGHAGDVCCGVFIDGSTTVAGSTACTTASACNGVFVCVPGDDEMCAFDAGQGCKPSSATILGWDICK